MTASYNLSQLGSNYLQGGSGSVARTTASKLQESVSVKDFGAVGDGVTDDTTAIQAAINATITNSGGNLFLPSGTYLISSALSIPASAGWRIYGASRNSTIIKQATNNTPIFLFNQTIIWGWTIDSLTGTWSSAQPSSNTAAIMFSFSGTSANTYYQLQIKNITCSNGFRCISQSPGAGCPVWGTDIANITYQSTNSGGAVYLVPTPAVGQPQIGIKSIYASCNNIAQTEYVINIGSCDSLEIGLIEANNMTNGCGLLKTQGGVWGCIGSIKVEVANMTVANSSFINATDSHLKIGLLALTTLTINSTGSRIYGITMGGGAADVYVDSLLLTYAATPVGNLYVVGGGTGKIPYSATFGNISGLIGQTNAWLTWAGSAATCGTTRVMTWENESVVTQGDADTTLAVGTNSQILAFTTNLTAGRTVQLTDGYSGVDTNLYAGFKWKIINAQPAYANSVTVTNSVSGTVATLASNGYVELTWYRFAWIVIGYGTWTGTTP
jgi:hypothetical protein